MNGCEHLNKRVSNRWNAGSRTQRWFGLLLMLAWPFNAVADDLEVGLRCLLEAYPEHLCDAQDNTLIWCDQTRMVFDREPDHSDFDERLNNADLADQMSQAYELGTKYDIPMVNYDPGRLRDSAFFSTINCRKRSAC